MNKNKKLCLSVITTRPIYSEKNLSACYKYISRHLTTYEW